MNWGYYCRTCGVSSLSWFRNPRRAIQAYRTMIPKIDALSKDLDVTLPTAHIPLLVFLSSHSGHDLWAECDTGVLRLCAGHPPAREVKLPRFAGRSSAESLSGRPCDRPAKAALNARSGAAGSG